MFYINSRFYTIWTSRSNRNILGGACFLTTRVRMARCLLYFRKVQAHEHRSHWKISCHWALCLVKKAPPFFWSLPWSQNRIWGWSCRLSSFSLWSSHTSKRRRKTFKTFLAHQLFFPDFRVDCRHYPSLISFVALIVWQQCHISHQHGREWILQK